MRGTAKFHELQEFFEKTIGKTPGVYFSCGTNEASIRANRSSRNPDLSWPHHFYENGQVDSAFRVFLSGWQFARVEANLGRATA